MVRKLARILLAMLVAVALGGITACGDAGPAEKAGQAMDEMGEDASDMAEQEEEKAH
jgi:predicted small lipoprotein YifL